MLGHYNDEAATREAFDGDWFKTGDLGYLDGDGFLFITGRKKNLIMLSNGKNVSPEELETALLRIGYIQEALVYADGDTITAEVYLDNKRFPNCTTQLEQDIEALNLTLPSYKHINKTMIRETEFPKTTTKKIKHKYTEKEIVHA
jgi:long-chain acyl-CoA synthetase